MYEEILTNIRNMLPRRDPEGNKGDFGHVLSVCGCERYQGAAVLAALGAVHCGAGLVTATFPRQIYAPLAAKLFAAYAQVGDVRALATIVGAEDLTEHDQRLLAFGQRFEQDFINQSLYEKRSMAETIALGRGIL